MERGAYFKKSEKMSDKIDSLITEVANLAGVQGSNGLPETFYVKKPAVYQEYWHLHCPQIKFYDAFYDQNGASSSKSDKSEPKPKQSQSPQKQQQMQSEKPEQQQQKGKQKQKQKKQKQKQQPSANDNNLPAIGRCVFVVGKVVEISEHPDADSMYVEMIDIGEEKPRQICSGIKGKVSMEEMRGVMCLVFSNLKPAKLRGVESAGMLLAASNDDKSKLEIVRPPKDAVIGERVNLEDEDLTQYKPTNLVKILKKGNPWNEIKDKLRINDKGIACFDGRPFKTSKGPLTAATLRNARIS
mmetsp:Transcript_43286/g.71520  ORF Transcript_43286/g.71520 Transcript_43286/m.71520 type:complete len:299 (-) Transcript_43286:68-964(-)